jgi:hypothetical protein
MGIEPATNSLDKSTNPVPGGAQSGALTPTKSNIDTDLAAVIRAWPSLPEAIRAGILAMVRAAGRQASVVSKVSMSTEPGKL